jgi:GMP synthase (glutamine-hydrolysing)
VRRRIVILKTGSTFEDVAAIRGDYEHWIARGLGVAAEEVVVVDAPRGASLPGPEGIDAMVVTGSAAMVTDREPWSVAAAELLRSVVQQGTPVLAICYGHQLLADALGGEVGDNPHGRQIGTIDLTLTEEGRRDPLLGVLGPPIRFQVTHRQVVLRPPDGSVHLASAVMDPHHAFRIGERAWGIQFHPEFDAQALRTYIERRTDLIRGEGGDPELLARRVEDTPSGGELLARFAQLL